MGMTVQNNPGKHGFTIVELLIVIIVIGILATLVLVAYSNVSDQAKTSAAKNDLEQVAKQLNLYKENSGGGTSYPADTSSLSYSSGTTLQYSVNNTVSPATYCVTATNGNKSFYVSSTAQSPVAGGCPGHGVNGVAPITNLATNPSVETNISGYAANNSSSSVALSTAQKYDGNQSILTQSLNTTNGYNGVKFSFNPTSGTTYTFSAWVYQPSLYGTGLGATVTGAGISGVQQGSLVTTTGAWARANLTFTALSSAAATLYIVTGSSNTVAAGATFYSDAYMLTQGSTLYNFADGDFPGWVWNGTANASTATGPVL